MITWNVNSTSCAVTGPAVGPGHVISHHDLIDRSVLARLPGDDVILVREFLQVPVGRKQVDRRQLMKLEISDGAPQHGICALNVAVGVPQERRAVVDAGAVLRRDAAERGLDLFVDFGRIVTKRSASSTDNGGGPCEFWCSRNRSMASTTGRSTHSAVFANSSSGGGSNGSTRSRNTNSVEVARWASVRPTSALRPELQPASRNTTGKTNQPAILTALVLMHPVELQRVPVRVTAIRRKSTLQNDLHRVNDSQPGLRPVVSR